MCLRAIFDDEDAVPSRELENPVHLAGPASKVHHDNRLGAAVDQGFDRVGVDVLADAIDVGKNRFSAALYYARGGSEETARSNYDFIPRPDGERLQRQLQGNRPVGHRHRVPRATIGRKLRLELPPFLAGPVIDLPATQHTLD